MNTKKNIIRGLSAFVIGLGLFAQSTNAMAGRQHLVRIENSASQSIWKVYASNPGNTNWGYDRLGDRVIIAGRSAVLDLDDGSGSCRADLRVVFRNGQEVVRQGVNICDIASWRIDDRRNGFTFASF